MLKNLVGQRFGKLIVIKRVDDFVRPSGKKDVQYLCKCDCGNDVVTKGYNLLHKNKQSCGCTHSLYHNVKNTYDLSQEYGIGYTTNTNKEFYFDLDDYDLIKNICWWEDANGYIVSKDKLLHRIIMSPDKGEVVDHINHNKFDNRKCNLRNCAKAQNNINTGLRIDNTSGYKGVTYRQDRSKWCATIRFEGKTYYLGLYTNKYDAIKARKEAEEKFFGEWSYQNSITKNTDL